MPYFGSFGHFGSFEPDWIGVVPEMSENHVKTPVYSPILVISREIPTKTRVFFAKPSGTKSSGF